MKNSVVASAPGKLMLFGEHSVVYGFPSIVTAVNQRLRVKITKNNNSLFNLHAPDVGIDTYQKNTTDLGKGEIPKGAAFLEGLYKRFLDKSPQRSGLDIETSSDFSSEFGFGSSSAVTVAFARALFELSEIEVSNNDLFQLCYQSVLDVQGVGSGFDLAAAIWGGTIYYVKPAKTIEFLTDKALPLIVGYTGIKADTVSLVKMVEEKKQENPEEVVKIFEKITAIVEMARTAILADDWQKVGLLMSENQVLLQDLGVSSLILDSLIKAANNSNAYGAKLSGAGGGDCMIAVANSKNIPIIEDRITEAQGRVLRVETSAPGACVES